VVACPHAPDRFVEGEGAGADVEGGPVETVVAAHEDVVDPSVAVEGGLVLNV
jgi:hypothetical protein